MMLANIGINQSALFLAIFSIDNSALPISVSASRRLTSKASKPAPDQAFRYRFCRVANAFNRLCDFSSLNNSSICQRQRYNAITSRLAIAHAEDWSSIYRTVFPLQTNVL